MSRDEMVYRNEIVQTSQKESLQTTEISITLKKTGQKATKPNFWRITFGILYFLVGFIGIISLLVAVLFEPDLTNCYLYRFFWCVAGTFLGFGSVVLHFWRSENFSWLWFLLLRWIQIVVMSSLVFGILHLWEKSSGFLFFFLSAPLCYTLGFQADRFWGLLESLVGKAKNLV
jgi:hypothetical protein